MKCSATFGILTLLLLLIPVTLAEKITVEKVVVNPWVQVGGEVVISLNITNPHKLALRAMIQDENSVGGHTITTLCQWIQIPATTGVYEYLTLSPLRPGQFSLGTLKLKYVNPSTQKEEMVMTTTQPSISVTGEKRGFSGQSTEIVRSCEFEEQSGLSRQSSAKQPPVTQKKTNAVQQSSHQNMESVKESLQKQGQESQAARETLAFQIEQEEQFQELDKKLKGYGYVPQKRDITLLDNSSAAFRYTFLRQDDDRAFIEGLFANKTIQKIAGWSETEFREYLALLRNDSRYQQYAKELNESEFAENQPVFLKESNQTLITTPFKKGEEIANITGVIANGTVIAVSFLRPESNLGLVWLLFWALLIVLGAGLYYFSTSPSQNVIVTSVRSTDIRADALAQLERAQQLFDAKEYKEAYALAGEALRHYLKHVYSSQKELTNSEAVTLVLSRAGPHELVRECLNLCGLVEFARYTPSKTDFGQIMKGAKKVIEEITSLPEMKMES